MTSIQMPQLGETIIEGTILKWLKQEGETIERDEPLFEISTDKVDTEVPSPVAGHRDEDPRRRGRDGGRRDGARRDRSETGAGDAPATRRGGSAPPTGPAPASRLGCRGRTGSAAGSAPPAAGLRAARGVVRSGAAGSGAAVADPVAAGAASWRPSTGSISPTIAGTGTGGRITKQDVEAAVAAGGAGRRRRGSARRLPLRAAPAMPPARRAGPAKRSCRCRTSARRSREHMVASLQTTARAWTMVEVNVDHLVQAAGAREGCRSCERHGVKLTYLPMVTRAITEALLAYPDGERGAPRRGARDPRRYVNMGDRRQLRRGADRAGDRRASTR